MDGDGMHRHGMAENATVSMMHHKMMMHMSFFWGKKTIILFHGWPGTSTIMYVLALFVVFFLAMLVEWLSHSRFIKQGTSHVSAAGLVHTLRVGLAYLVMLAVMSFNGGVFIVAVAGHSLGFFLFGSRVFKPATENSPGGDLPSMTC